MASVIFVNALENSLKKSSSSRQKGQGLVEYAVLLVVIVGIVILATPNLQTAIMTAFNKVSNTLNTAS